MKKNAPNPMTDIVCDEQEKRLSAYHQVEILPNVQAIPVLKKGLTHWDRKLRNLCASDLVRRLGSKSAPIVLPLRAKGLLYASCSSVALLEQEDRGLIKYLEKTRKGRSAVSGIAKELLLRTKYHAKAEAAKAKVEETKAKKDAARANKEALKKIENLRKKTASKKPAANTDSYWYDDPEIPIMKKVDSDCAAYVRMNWGVGRGMDHLYKVTEIPKRSGGTRQIEAPCPSLKVLQRGILKYVFGKAHHNDACHGFRGGHSIATNAAPHVGKDVVLNLDLKDFFPSVNAGRVYGIYKSFVGDGKYARFLTDVSVFKSRLPQGAPTSPMIANLTCIRLDRRLAGLAEKIGANYTRYADDLTFSGSEIITRFIPAIKAIVAEEGFQVALPKLRIHRKGSRQEVTGLTVNQKVSVPRAIRRRLRAAVHTVQRGNTPTWKGNEITSESLKGHIHYVSSIHPDLGAKLFNQVSRKPKKKKK